MYGSSCYVLCIDLIMLSKSTVHLEIAQGSVRCICVSPSLAHARAVTSVARLDENDYRKDLWKYYANLSEPTWFLCWSTTMGCSSRLCLDVDSHRLASTFNCDASKDQLSQALYQADLTPELLC